MLWRVWAGLLTVYSACLLHRSDRRQSGHPRAPTLDASKPYTLDAATLAASILSSPPPPALLPPSPQPSPQRSPKPSSPPKLAAAGTAPGPLLVPPQSLCPDHAHLSYSQHSPSPSASPLSLPFAVYFAHPGSLSLLPLAD